MSDFRYVPSQTSQPADACAAMEKAMACQKRQTGVIYQYVWLSGSEGQRDPGHWHAEHFGALWVAMHHIALCQNYIHE